MENVAKVVAVAVVGGQTVAEAKPTGAIMSSNDMMWEGESHWGKEAWLMVIISVLFGVGFLSCYVISKWGAPTSGVGRGSAGRGTRASGRSSLCVEPCQKESKRKKKNKRKRDQKDTRKKQKQYCTKMLKEHDPSTSLHPLARLMIYRLQFS